MKILAGRFRNRRLLSPPGAGTRPITSRVKERLFGRLGDLVAETRVLDVFAGTGTIGLEAVSRGAASAVFLERDRRVADLLRRNVATLGLEDVTLVWEADVFRCSFRPREADALVPFDLIFFDPPYPDAAALRRGRPLWKALARLGKSPVSSEAATLILRVPTGAEVDRPPAWTERSAFVEGGMTLFEWTRSDPEPEPPADDDGPVAGGEPVAD